MRLRVHEGVVLGITFLALLFTMALMMEHGENTFAFFGPIWLGAIPLGFLLKVEAQGRWDVTSSKSGFLSYSVFLAGAMSPVYCLFLGGLLLYGTINSETLFTFLLASLIGGMGLGGFVGWSVWAQKEVDR